jgi:V/A-type H+-transporting ATPase subunit B
MSDRLHVTEYQTSSWASGPLLFVENVAGVGYREVVEVLLPNGQTRRGQVLEVDRGRAVVEVFGGTRGLDLVSTRVRTRGETVRLGVGRELRGRVFDGVGQPIDGGPPPSTHESRDVHGQPLNPTSRANPADFIQTGLSAIDGLNTLVRGQKLPIFTGAGLPASELAARIAADACVPGAEGEDFVVVFAAMGITRRESELLRVRLSDSGALSRAVVFLNLADSPVAERLLAPRAALTAAEYLAFEEGHHVLVLLTDMTHYCEALREVAAAREELPGRRGYPGYMYTDLASLYERAGRLRDRPGSITQLIISSMPDDDITHPVPDLTGYITEGQIVLSRDLHGRGLDPPIDVLLSLSRLMNAGIGEGRTRGDHRALANQLYASYAHGRDLRRLVAVVGEGALSPGDRRHLHFADAFEARFIHQAGETRSIEATLELAWQLLGELEDDELKRIPSAMLAARRGEQA